MRKQNFQGMFLDLFDEILFLQVFDRLVDSLNTGKNLVALKDIQKEVEDFKKSYGTIKT